MPVDGHASLGYDSGTNRITTAGYVYDAAGNQIKAPGADGNGLLFEYDAAGRVSVIRKQSDNSLVQAFQYGSTNARLMDTNYGFGYMKLFASTGGTTLAEYTEFTAAAPTWTKSYTYLGDKQLATITPNGSGGEYVEFNHPDRLGTRLVTNQAGGTAYEQVHLPFGTALNAETSLTDNPRRFTSYDRSSATGLDYAINRTYDSKAGRFTQVDPIGMKSVDLNTPQSLNLYNYCGNDPVNYLDPTGLSWISRFFGFIKKIGKLIKNVLNIIKWVAIASAIVVSTIASFGLVLGIVIGFAAVLGLVVAKHILGIVMKTIWRSIKESVREKGLSLSSILSGLWKGLKRSFGVIRAIFARGLATLLTVYGYFCAPNFGVDGPTRDFRPLDELDSACRQHDQDMLNIDALLDSGKFSKREWKRLKNKADLKFMKRAILSGNSAAGIYMLGLQFGFLFRIIFR